MVTETPEFINKIVIVDVATGQTVQREMTETELESLLASQVATLGDEQNASTPDTPSDPA
jgi:hypothetical protein